MSNERLYVGNLSWSSDENSINAAFASYGDVREVKVITDRDTDSHAALPSLRWATKNKHKKRSKA